MIEKQRSTQVNRRDFLKKIRLGGTALTDPTKLATLKAYKLRADSPCVGAGLPIKDNGGRDFWGNKVLKGQKPTIGACEKPYHPGT
jgi:hypothetical protein